MRGSRTNALAITTDGRKLALDARLISPTAKDFPGSKVNALVGKVLGIWRKTEARRGTQMVFCDMGVNPTPWGFSVYDDVVEKLVDHGIPRQRSYGPGGSYLPNHTSERVCAVEITRTVGRHAKEDEKEPSGRTGGDSAGAVHLAENRS